MKQTAGDPEPQIIVFGGCGIADPWVDPRIFRYVLDATAVEHSRVALLASASGDDQHIVSRLHRVYRLLGAVTEHLELDGSIESHRQGFLSQSFDLIHVEGGNTAFLMHQLQRSGMEGALREAWLNGVVLTGTSAGASCWFEHAMSASLFSFLEADETIVALPGLGFLPYSICVHYDASPRRRQAYCASIAAGLQPGFGLDHNAGLHFNGTSLRRIIAMQPGAGASEVKKRGPNVDGNHLQGESPGPLEWKSALSKAWHNLVQPLRRRMPQILRPKAP